MNDGTSMTLVGDCEIVITRSFDAPMALVFEVLTKEDHVRRWWLPKSRGLTFLVCTIDFRLGGSYRYQFRTADGHEFGFSGTFLEIEAPTRVVQTEVFDPFPEAGATVTVTLTESNGRTTMTNRAVYPSAEVRDQVVATGMEDGMRESMRQLTEVIESLRTSGVSHP